MTTSVLTLTDLATAINVEHAAAESAAAEAIHRARHAGELLLQAKAQIEHGQWLPWLTANCTVAVRTAQAYMRLAREWPALETKCATVAHLGVKEALNLLSVHVPTDEEPHADLESDMQITGISLLEKVLGLMDAHLAFSFRPWETLTVEDITEQSADIQMSHELAARAFSLLNDDTEGSILDCVKRLRLCDQFIDVYCAIQANVWHRMGEYLQILRQEGDQIKVNDLSQFMKKWQKPPIATQE